jgi:hypothetical protein
MKQFTCLAIAATISLAWSPSHAVDAKPVSQPSTKAMAASDLLKLDDGRSGKGNLIATTGIRGFSKPASATAHALIMTIGEYQGNIPKLKGVAFDAATATEIAQRMGVPPANMHFMKDGELTLDGMRRAFDELEAKLGGNDQVFIYYSGHGGRQILEENGAERCAESLITVDGKGFFDVEMEDRLKTLSKKAQKTVVFLDACHSGGVTTRSVNSAQPLYSAKSWSPPGQNCVKPTNVLTRNIVLNKTPGNGGGNFVYIAAARDSEISLDQPGKGGVATQAWLACLSGGAKDIDGSGGLSAEEVRLCAQNKIDQQLKNVHGYLPHHVAINGNPSTVLSYALREPAPIAVLTPAPAQAPQPTLAVPAAMLLVSAPSATAAAPSPLPTKPVPTVAPAASKPPVSAPVAIKPSALAALNDIYNSRDDRRLTSISATKTTLKIGSDAIDFTLTSREGGYVYLLMVGSDGQTFDLLFPNQLDPNNVIEAGGSMRLPRTGWQLSAGGPPGKDTLLAVVTDSPRDFSMAGLKPSGPFSAIEAAAAKDIQLVTSGSAIPTNTQCADSSAVRNLSVKKQCSTGYSAALLTVEEVR